MEKIDNQLKYFLRCLKKSDIIIPKPIKMIISGMIISGMIIEDNIISASKKLFPYILTLSDNVNMDDVWCMQKWSFRNG